MALHFFCTVLILFHLFYVPKSINVLVWPNEIDAEYLDEFEARPVLKFISTILKQMKNCLSKYVGRRVVDMT